MDVGRASYSRSCMTDIIESISKVETQLSIAKTQGNRQKIIALQNVLKALLRIKNNGK